MDWQTFALALGTVFTGVTGVVLVVHEFRRRDRRALTAEGREMSDDLTDLRHDLIVCRRYAFELAGRLTSYGHPVPDPPEMRDR